MSRTPRKPSESNLYHVFARGVGRQLIFEDREDNEFFCRLLERFIADCEGAILAWCLMGNHFHLLLKMELPELSLFMKRLQVTYALHFNAKYERPGCLFQGRFGSEPIGSESQLMAAVRYIHLNPQVAGLAPFESYEWSSYKEYIGAPSLCDASLVLALTDGIVGLKEMHLMASSEDEFMEESTDDGRAKKRYMSDNKLIRSLREQHGDNWRTTLLQCERAQRDEALRQLKQSGATIRQIARLTGIGRRIIQKA